LFLDPFAFFNLPGAPFYNLWRTPRLFGDWVTGGCGLLPAGLSSIGLSFSTVNEAKTPAPAGIFCLKAGLSARNTNYLQVRLFFMNRRSLWFGRAGTKGVGGMDRVIHFPDRRPLDNKRRRLKRNCSTFFLLLLFLALIFQLGSGLYSLITYNRRLHKMEALLREKRQLVEGLERQLRQTEFKPPLEMEGQQK